MDIIKVMLWKKTSFVLALYKLQVTADIFRIICLCIKSIYIYTFMCVYIYVCVCVCLCVCVYTYIFIHTHMFRCLETPGK